MPLYEYECSDCGERFEALVLKSNVPPCPKCQGNNLEQLISMFMVDSETTRQSSLAGARQRNKKVQKEMKVAEAEYIREHRH